MPVRYDKLVRDRIPEIIQAQGYHPVTRILDDANYQAALLAKLAEETREAEEASAAELPDELADIVELVQALAASVGMSRAQRRAQIITGPGGRSFQEAVRGACHRRRAIGRTYVGADADQATCTMKETGKLGCP
jgi:predicted house-cleaning noncanonical NTP pyrophosphatase (MazG superfamily)